MTIRDNKFTIAIEGENVSPSTVSARDLFEIVLNLETALAVVAKHSAGRLAAKLGNEEFTISLVEVSPGSNRITVAANEKMIKAAGRVSSAIARNDFSSIPVHAHPSLRALWKKSKSTNWALRFQADGNGVSQATISGDKEILRPGAVSGRTTLYGRVHRVGGEAKRTATFILLSGDKLTITIATKNLAEDLGHNLYKVVGLNGEATWDVETWKISDFRAESATEYREADAVEAFECLAEVAGDHWDDVDPDEFVRELRAD